MIFWGKFPITLKTPTVADSTVDYRLTVMSAFMCPSDPQEEINPLQRIRDAGGSQTGAGKSNYVAVWGNDPKGPNLPGPPANDNSGNYTDAQVANGATTNGITFVNSQTKIGEITDGTSNTFLIGERDGGLLS